MLEDLLIRFDGWPGLLAYAFAPFAILAILIASPIWIGKIFWIFCLGGFIVVFKYWQSWLDNRWLELTIGLWMGTQEFTTVFIQPPSQNARSLAAMEAFFKNIHAMHTTKSEKNAYFEGNWYKHLTIEFHSIGGRVGIFARLFKSDLSLFRQALIAHYPDCYITECDDPLGYLPMDWVRKTGVLKYEQMAGSDFALLKDDMYPTRTWRELQENGTIALFDPIPVLLSAFEAVLPNEHLVLQFVIRPQISGPMTGDWSKAKQKEAEKLKKELATNNDVEVTKFGTMALTREEQQLIQAVQQKINQGVIFQTKVRFMALSETNKAVNAYLGAAANFFKQLDGLKNTYYPTDPTKTTKVSNMFPIFDNLYWKYEKYHRQERMYNAIRRRSWDSSGPWHIQTADALAAMIHMPMTDLADMGVTMRIQSNFGLTQNAAPNGSLPLNLPT